MTDQNISWKSELENMVASATNVDDKIAYQAFQKAIGPYLDNPKLLRTLLGKIAQTPEAVAMVVSKGEFSSLTALKDQLPEDVKLVHF